MSLHDKFVFIYEDSSYIKETFRIAAATFNAHYIYATDFSVGSSNIGSHRAVV